MESSYGQNDIPFLNVVFVYYVHTCMFSFQHYLDKCAMMLLPNVTPSCNNLKLELVVLGMLVNLRLVIMLVVSC